jgi:hypothetical protein
MKTVCGALLVIVAASASTTYVPASPSFRTYRDQANGISFRYPSDWTTDATQLIFYGSDPLLLRLNADEGYDEPIARMGWIFRTQSKVQPTAGGVSFVYAILPEKDTESCKQRALRWNEDSGSTSGFIVVNGIRLSHGVEQDAGVGHSWSYDIFTVFDHAKCYGFQASLNNSHVDKWKPTANDSRAVAELRKIIDTVQIGRH